MNLAEYAKTPEKRSQLARAVGADPQYMWQLVKNWRGKRPSPALARRIESATHGEVTRYDLRPDVFGVAPAQEQAA